MDRRIFRLAFRWWLRGVLAVPIRSPYLTGICASGQRDHFLDERIRRARTDVEVAIAGAERERAVRECEPNLALDVGHRLERAGEREVVVEDRRRHLRADARIPGAIARGDVDGER